MVEKVKATFKTKDGNSINFDCITITYRWVRRGKIKSYEPIKEHREFLRQFSEWELLK